MPSDKPLSLIIEDAKLQTVRAVNQVRAASGLPAYLFEGIIVSILADIKEEKSFEILNDSTMYKKQRTGGEDNSKVKSGTPNIAEEGERNESNENN